MFWFNVIVISLLGFVVWGETDKATKYFFGFVLAMYLIGLCVYLVCVIHDNYFA